MHPTLRTLSAVCLVLPTLAFVSAAPTSATSTTPAPREDAAASPSDRHPVFTLADPGRGRRAIAMRPKNPKTPPKNSGSGNGLVDLAPTSFWTQPVGNAPLADSSAAIASYVDGRVKNNWGGVAAFNAYSYNLGFYRVDASTPRVDVKWVDCMRLGFTPRGVYTNAAHFKSVPVPRDAIAASGTDGAMAIYDRRADKVWEFWKMSRDATTGGWQACWGGRLDNASTQIGQFPATFGVSASGLVMSGGVISMSEVRRGSIDHAMYLGVIAPRHFSTYSWPANRSDGYSTDPNAPMEGQRLRLDPSLNLNAYNLSPLGRMVAKAAQTYGFIVSDKSGAVGVATESGKAVELATGVNPWNALMNSPSYAVMKNFPWEKLQAMPKDWGKPAQ